MIGKATGACHATERYLRQSKQTVTQLQSPFDNNFTGN